MNVQEFYKPAKRPVSDPAITAAFKERRRLAKRGLFRSILFCVLPDRDLNEEIARKFNLREHDPMRD